MSDDVSKCVKCGRVIEGGGVYCKHHRPSPEIQTRARDDGDLFFAKMPSGRCRTGSGKKTTPTGNNKKTKK